jgi:hypothetical protein
MLGRGISFSLSYSSCLVLRLFEDLGVDLGSRLGFSSRAGSATVGWTQMMARAIPFSIFHVFNRIQSAN